MYILSAIMYI